MCFEFCFMCSVKVILTELKLVLVECAVESCWCTLKDCSGSWRDAAWDGFKWRMMFTGSTGAGQSSASHSEMVYPRHHGATSERFQTVAHRLQDFAAWQGLLRTTAKLWLHLTVYKSVLYCDRLGHSSISEGTVNWTSHRRDLGVRNNLYHN